VKTDSSEEGITSIIRVERINELGTTLTVARKRISSQCALVGSYFYVVASWLILFTLMMEVIHSCDMSVATKARPYHIPAYVIVMKY
jgi:hypothetical protein